VSPRAAAFARLVVPLAAPGGSGRSAYCGRRASWLTTASAPTAAARPQAPINGSVTLWDIATGTVITTLTDPNSDGVQSLAFAPDGHTLAAANELGVVDLWDTRTRKITRTFTNPQGTQGVTSVAFSPGGTLLAAGDKNGTTYLWRVTQQVTS
jgi:WD40 repeat protein